MIDDMDTTQVDETNDERLEQEGREIADAIEAGALNAAQLVERLKDTQFPDAPIVNSVLDREQGPARTVVKRRIVTKVTIRERAQDVLMNAVANLLGYWQEDEVNRQMLAELGITPEQFDEVLVQQADRVAKTLKFERAWRA